MRGFRRFRFHSRRTSLLGISQRLIAEIQRLAKMPSLGEELVCRGDKKPRYVVANGDLRMSRRVQELKSEFRRGYCFRDEALQR